MRLVLTVSFLQSFFVIVAHCCKRICSVVHISSDKSMISMCTPAEHLQVPTTQKTDSAATETGCLMFLKCSSSDEGVTLSWHVNPPSVQTWSSTEGRTSHLFANVSNTQDFVEFNCTSSRHMENASHALKQKCDGKFRSLVFCFTVYIQDQVMSNMQAQHQMR